MREKRIKRCKITSEFYYTHRREDRHVEVYHKRNILAYRIPGGIRGRGHVEVHGWIWGSGEADTKEYWRRIRWIERRRARSMDVDEEEEGEEESGRSAHTPLHGGVAQRPSDLWRRSRDCNHVGSPALSLPWEREDTMWCVARRSRADGFLLLLWGVMSHDLGMFMRPDSRRPWMHCKRSRIKVPESVLEALVFFKSPCFKPTLGRFFRTRYKPDSTTVSTVTSCYELSYIRHSVILFFTVISI